MLEDAAFLQSGGSSWDSVFLPSFHVSIIFAHVAHPIIVQNLIKSTQEFVFYVKKKKKIQIFSLKSL